MKRGIHAIGMFVMGLLLFSEAPCLGATESRHFTLEWSVHVGEIPEGAKQAVVWVALPQERPEQEVSNLEIPGDSKWTFVEDPTFHNRVAKFVFSKPPRSVSIRLQAQVLRRAVMKPRPATLGEEERALYLRTEALVSLSPRIRALADSIGGTSRSRYDYVLAAMDYDKTVPGWGNGDSERACDVRKGNCTDFHSLFMSLSRAAGVPVVFEMGFPTLQGGESNRNGGYHCWAWFYDDGSSSWVPVDISEADKHPEKAEFFFGHLDADRITFSRGRDIELPGMRGKPLNYLPAGAYAEEDGVPLETVQRTLSYTVDSPSPAGSY